MPALTPDDPTLFELEELGVKAFDSPNDDLSVDSSRSSRKFRCKWDQRYNAARYFVGYQAINYTGGVAYLSRVLPQSHPQLEQLRATKVVGIHGFQWVEMDFPDYGKEDILCNKFTRAEFEVIYEHVPYEILSDDDNTDAVADSVLANVVQNGFEGFRFVEHPYGPSQGGGEALTPPAGSLSFITAANVKRGVVPGNPAIVAPQETFRIMWHRLPQAAWPFEFNSAASILEADLFGRIYIGLDTDAGVHGASGKPYFGCINDGVFYDRPAGTVLLVSITPHRRRSPTGVGYEWDIEYEFAYKPQGWLKLLDWTDGKYYFVGRGATAYTAITLPDDTGLYNARDFTRLFNLN